MKKAASGKQKPTGNSAFGVSIGLCFGVAYGIIFRNFALGIGIGLCLGVGIGATTPKKTDDNDKHQGE